MNEPHTDEPHIGEPHAGKPHTDEPHTDEPHADEWKADVPRREKASIWEMSVTRQLRPLTRQLPPATYSGLFLLGYALTTMLLVYVYGVSVRGRDLEMILRSRAVTVCGGVFGYAAFRVIAFHPFFNTTYYNWLRLTPWNPPTPLPLGPPRINAIDVSLLLLAEAAIMPAPLAWLAAVPIIYFVVSSVLMAAALWGLSTKFPTYATLMGLGFVFWAAWFNPIASLVLAAAVYCFALYWQSRSFQDFPWSGNVATLENPFASVSPKFGFPFDELAPVDQSPGLRGERFWGAILVGWLGMTAVWGAHIEVQTALGGALLVVASLFGPLIRIYLYARGRSLPRNLTGRFSTGKLIHWSHDRMFVVPFLAMIVGPTMGITVANWDRILLLPWAATLTLLLLAFGPPSLNDWRLSADSTVSDAVYKMQKKLFEQI